MTTFIGRVAPSILLLLKGTRFVFLAMHFALPARAGLTLPRCVAEWEGGTNWTFPGAPDPVAPC